MNRFLLTAAFAVLAAVPAVTSAQEIFAREVTAPDKDDVYFIAQLKVDDMEAFQSEYVPGTAALLGESSAVVLAVTPTPTVVEGAWDSNWTVLMRFETRADFDTFYEDSTYQDNFVPVRLKAVSINNIILLPAFDPAVFAG